MKTTTQARDLKAGDKLNLWRKGRMQVLTVEKVVNLSKFTYIYYAGDNFLPDVVTPWSDWTEQLVS